MSSSSRRLAALTASIAVAGLAAASSAGAAPPPHSQANLGKNADFRLTLLHNNDGESKLATGSSVPGYGGAARFKTVVDRLRADAAQKPRGRAQPPQAEEQGHAARLLGRQLPRRTRAAYGFQTGRPWPDAVVANALGYDAMTIGNHEFDFGQARLAKFIAGVDDDIPFITANLGFDGTLLEDLADDRRIAPSVIVERKRERIGVIGLTTPDIVDLLARQRHDRAGSRTGRERAGRPAQAPRRRQDHRLRPPPGHRRRQRADPDGARRRPVDRGRRRRPARQPGRHADPR